MDIKMNDDDFTELDLIMAENDRMKKALKDIAEAYKGFKPMNKAQVKNAHGMMLGLMACASVAQKALKENEDGRKKENQ